jgi:hypothetical protein
MLIVKTMKKDTKLMKIVPNCTKFELNEAIDNTKVKVNTRKIELVLKGAKSKLNLATDNTKAKLDAKLN